MKEILITVLKPCVKNNLNTLKKTLNLIIRVSKKKQLSLRSNRGEFPSMERYPANYLSVTKVTITIVFSLTCNILLLVNIFSYLQKKEEIRPFTHNKLSETSAAKLYSAVRT